jgi:outer membrane protein OmpA-like peptidoglycan-associated protein
MHARNAFVCSVASLALFMACAPKKNYKVDVKSEPVGAVVTVKGKSIGPAPQSIAVAAPEDLLRILATRGKEEPVEKRIRFLAPDRAELLFVFGADQSAMAKLLGFPKILVFDYGAGFTFDVNQFVIKSDFEPYLDRQAELLKKYFANVDVNICGHTDSTGDKDHNLELSLNRAKAVADALVARGVPKERLKVLGYGSDYPVASNDTPETRALNRRTEIILPQ